MLPSVGVQRVHTCLNWRIPPFILNESAAIPAGGVQRASPRAVTLGDSGDTFFSRIFFFKNAESKLNLFEVD